MIPSVWTFALLTLAAFRTWRLLAIDTFPPVEKLRNRLLFDDRRRLRKPVAEFLKCPWCLGAHVVFWWWAAWVITPHWTMVAAVPFALSAMVGLVAVRLDP